MVPPGMAYIMRAKRRDRIMSFISVTKEEFFATVGRLNVHPRSERDASYWETPNREVLGKSTPGWKCEGPKGYFIHADLK
jgi:hypothetical protein